MKKVLVLLNLSLTTVIGFAQTETSTNEKINLQSPSSVSLFQSNSTNGVWASGTIVGDRWGVFEDATSAKERLSILPIGNIGIGTNTPTARLDIRANQGQTESFLKLGVADASGDYFQIANATATAGQFIPALKGHRATDNRASLYLTGSTSDANDTGNNALINFSARRTSSAIQNRPLFSWDNFTQRKMTMDANGDLGIGTSNPLAKLHVVGDQLGSVAGDKSLLASFQSKVSNGSKLQIFNKRNENGTDWVKTSLRLQKTIDATDQAFIDFGIEGKNADYGLGFGTRNGYSGTAQTRMVIEGNGNVGIGTTTPRDRLEVLGNIRSNNKFVVTGIGALEKIDNDFKLWSVKKLNLTAGSVTGASNNHMTIDTNGNVGIGTTTPTTRLHVSNGNSGGTTHSLADLTVEDDSNTMINVLSPNSMYGHYSFSDTDDNYVGGMQYHHPTDKLEFRVNNHATSDLTINADGNVGIGTTSPTSKLHISGGGTQTLTIEGTGTGNYQGANLILSAQGVNEGNSHRATWLMTHRGTDGTAMIDLQRRGENSKYNGSLMTYSDNRGWQFAVANNPTSGITKTFNITNTGNVGIGTTAPDAKLTVKGKIHAEEVQIDLSVPAPDYVFLKEYDLNTIEEVEAYIKKEGHLPNIPSAKVMESEGVELGTMNMKLLEKIEELTLYTIQQQKEISDLQEIKKKNEDLEARLAKLEALLLKN